jgi:hypothetical protein
MPHSEINLMRPEPEDHIFHSTNRDHIIFGITFCHYNFRGFILIEKQSKLL